MVVALSLVLSLATVAAQAQSGSGASRSSAFCDRTPALTPAQQDRALRFAAVVRTELAGSAAGAALISRSGLDLSRFEIRYSHMAVAWRDDGGAWSARQLYYACDEHRPRLYDQGLAGFTMGIDDPGIGYVSIVRLPADVAESLRFTALQTSAPAELLAARYSADAYVYSTRYQNCNQWVVELLAAAWGGLSPGVDLRSRAQRWLHDAGYAPDPVQVGSHWLMLASVFVPLLHVDDHPPGDRDAMTLRISLPSTVEAFVHQRLPQAERIELCHDAHQVVVHRGWDRVAAGCLPGAGDRVEPFD